MKKRTVSVRLDSAAARRLDQAARLTHQSRGAFLQHAGDTTAQQILREWAVARYQEGTASASELAEQTGLTVEEIMAARGDQGQEAALAQFLASCRTVAETQGNQAFLRFAEEAVRTLNDSSATSAEMC